MTPGDVPDMLALAAIVHPGFPEDAEVLAERLALYPAGCFALDGERGLAGYLLSHPWHEGAVPALNRRLGAVPADGIYYLHDLALHPATQGSGAAGRMVRRLFSVAAGFPAIALVAVNNSAPFWGHHGFVEAAAPAKLASYGDDARYMVRAQPRQEAMSSSG
jgi:GNAT superfamily N-acetyltransferase